MSVRDALTAAFDSHAAVTAGKEAGVFSENVGVGLGEIGAEAPGAWANWKATPPHEHAPAAALAGGSG